MTRRSSSALTTLSPIVAVATLILGPPPAHTAPAATESIVRTSPGLVDWCGVTKRTGAPPWSAYQSQAVSRPWPGSCRLFGEVARQARPLRDREREIAGGAVARN